MIERGQFRVSKSLKCHQDVITLGIVNLGGWNMLAFWDHLDSCAKCREAEAELIGELNKVINGELVADADLPSRG